MGDNKDYGLWLLRAVAKPPISDIFEDSLRGTDVFRRGRVERDGGFILRSVPPAVDVCGAEYTGEAGASYFHRLKLQEKSSRNDMEEDRYFICMRRLPSPAK